MSHAQGYLSSRFAARDVFSVMWIALPRLAPGEAEYLE